MQLSNHPQILALDRRHLFNSGAQFMTKGQGWAQLGVGLSDCLPRLLLFFQD